LKRESFLEAAGAKIWLEPKTEQAFQIKLVQIHETPEQEKYI
jgi:hypothetical protein